MRIYKANVIDLGVSVPFLPTMRLFWFKRSRAGISLRFLVQVFETLTPPGKVLKNLVVRIYHPTLINRIEPDQIA
jgi:hypothetical protein